jgi:hypothetical protein
MHGKRGCCICGRLIGRDEVDAMALTFSSLWINLALEGPQETRFAHYACVHAKLEPLLTEPLDPELFPVR